MTAKRTAKSKDIVIKGEDVRDFGTMMICAVRYAIGRETYMPGLVQDFIRKYPQAVSENVRSVMLRDIEEHDRVSEHDIGDGKKLTIDHLGDTKIDRPGWIRFRDWLKELDIEGENE